LFQHRKDLKSGKMQNTLSTQERVEIMKSISSFHSLFGEPGELRDALWPLIVAAVGSEYFEDLDPSERQKMFIAYDEVLKFSEAACKLLHNDIDNYLNTVS
jgi:hypothetical protein